MYVLFACLCVWLFVVCCLCFVCRWLMVVGCRSSFGVCWLLLAGWLVVARSRFRDLCWLWFCVLSWLLHAGF